MKGTHNFAGFTEEQIARYCTITTYLNEHGIDAHRAHVRAYSLVSGDKSIPLETIVAQETQRALQKGVPDWKEPDLDPDPEENYLIRERLQELKEFIGEDWDEIVLAATITYPGDEASIEEKQEYNRLKQKLYRFRKKAGSTAFPETV